jgi:hypothetical protein
MKRFALSMLTLIVVWPAPAARAQGTAPHNCAGAEARQFDFWVGNWNVTVAGKQAGTNEVTLEENGCVLHEHWTSSRGGSTGQSFNFFDRTISRWHQFWVDNGGNYLHLTGAYADGKLVLTGEAPGADGKPADQRLTFFQNADGSVRQLWETSADHGTTWQVAFDGLYRKR